jgi:hypothetical protein
MNMSNNSLFVLAGAMLISGAALGKLPVPTPEEQAAIAATKAMEQEQLEKEKLLLERAQDRIAERYGNGSASRRTGERVSDTTMPKSAVDLPRSGGPTPASPRSQEAHSAPAK